MLNLSDIKSQIITSTKNPKVQDAAKLSERKHRDQTGLMLIEGVKELRLALKGGIAVKRLFYCEELFTGREERDILKTAGEKNADLVPVARHVFEKLAYREDSFGLAAAAEKPAKTLEDVPLTKLPLLIVVEGVEKPGNLGAILRSADAAGVDGVIVCGKSTDIYNPNVIRASLGTVFTVPVTESPIPDTIDWLKEKNIKTVATTPHAQMEYFDADMKGPCAIVMGSEHGGLSNIWLHGADVLVRIPMKGQADSLNLATAATILLYEAVRQREKSPQNRLIIQPPVY